MYGKIIGYLRMQAFIYPAHRLKIQDGGGRPPPQVLHCTARQREATDSFRRDAALPRVRSSVNALYLTWPCTERVATGVVVRFLCRGTHFACERRQGQLTLCSKTVKMLTEKMVVLQNRQSSLFCAFKREDKLTVVRGKIKN